MKGKEAEYVIPLARLFSQPRTKRSSRAITEIKRFVAKHTRSQNVVITGDVNAKVWERSKHAPRNLDVLLQEHDGKIYVYAKGSKQIEEDREKREQAEKDKKKKAKEGKGEEKKKEEKGPEAQLERGSSAHLGGAQVAETKKEGGELAARKKETDEELEEKRREKREMERAAEKAAIKRGTDS